MRVENYNFKENQRVSLRLADNSVVLGTVQSTDVDPTLLSFFPEGVNAAMVWVFPHRLEAVGRTLGEAWADIPLGGEFHLEAKVVGGRRFKASTSQYVLVYDKDETAELHDYVYIEKYEVIE